MKSTFPFKAIILLIKFRDSVMKSDFHKTFSIKITLKKHKLFPDTKYLVFGKHKDMLKKSFILTWNYLTFLWKHTQVLDKKVLKYQWKRCSSIILLLYIIIIFDCFASCVMFSLHSTLKRVTVGQETAVFYFLQDWMLMLVSYLLVLSTTWYRSAHVLIF